jgi:hypothetical protein
MQRVNLGAWPPMAHMRVQTSLWAPERKDGASFTAGEGRRTDRQLQFLFIEGKKHKN